MPRKNTQERYRGLTFARASDKIDRKYKDRDLNAIEQRSFLAEISELIKLQESERARFSTMGKNSRPRKASEYNDGGILPIRKLGLPTQVQTMQPQPGQLQYDLQNLPAVQSSVTPTKPSFMGGVRSYLSNNAYAPLAIGKGLEFAGKAAMGLRGYDKVSPQFNPYEGEIRTTMQQRGIDTQAMNNQALAGANATSQQIGQSRSAAVQQALNQNVGTQLGRTMSQNSLQAQQANNQYASDYAQTINNLGAQQVQARNYAEQLNNQSKAGYQMGIQSLLESVGNAGQQLTNFRAGLAQQQILASVLSTQDFAFGEVRGILRSAANAGDIPMDEIIRISSNAKGMTPSQVQAELAQVRAQYNQSLETARQ